MATKSEDLHDGKRNDWYKLNSDLYILINTHMQIKKINLRQNSYKSCKSRSSMSIFQSIVHFYWTISIMFWAVEIGVNGICTWGLMWETQSYNQD